MCHILIKAVSEIAQKDYYLILTEKSHIILLNGVWSCVGDLGLGMLVSKVKINAIVEINCHPKSTDCKRMGAILNVPEVPKKTVGDIGL